LHGLGVRVLARYSIHEIRPAPSARTENAQMRQSFYAPFEPYATTTLDVSPIHRLYVEESGNPSGTPVVYLHGGPGAGSKPDHRRYFDPARFRVVLFDQRGAGKSTPHASLELNTTQDLVADIERIREHLGIERWLVVGGSWGSTLAIAYAEAHPARVTELILRGLFLCRDEEIEWMYQKGASFVYPDLWEDYIAPIPEDRRDDFVAAYHEQLTSDDEGVRLKAARAWEAWEVGMLNLMPNDADIAAMTDESALATSRIECHYFKNKIFLPDNALLDGIPAIAHLPATLVHGRHDMICPAKTAWDVHKAWPGSKLHLIPDASHAFDEPGIVDAMVRAADAYAERVGGGKAG
jgi:proline iminopeptidase